MFDRKHFRKLRLFVVWIADSPYLQNKIDSEMQRAALFLFVCLCGCVSQKHKYNVVRKEIFDVQLTFGEVKKLPFNKRSEPYVTCLKKNYAEAFNEVELAWKCVIFRERLAHAIIESDSIHRLAIDSLNQVPDDTLKVWLKNLMKPGKEFKEPPLTDSVHIHIEQTIFNNEQEAIVIEGDHHHRNYYSLRKEDGLWKIYSDKDPEHKHDHD